MSFSFGFATFHYNYSTPSLPPPLLGNGGGSGGVPIEHRRHHDEPGGQCGREGTPRGGGGGYKPGQLDQFYA